MNRFTQPPVASAHFVPLSLHQEIGLATATLGVICFLPTTLFYLFSATSNVTGFATTSHATGAGIASLVAGLIYGLTPAHTRTAFTLDRWLLLVFPLMLLLSAHLLVASLFNELSLRRAGMSLLGLASVLAGAFFIYGTLTKVSDVAIKTAAGIVRLAFLTIAVFALLGLQPGGGALISTDKSVFPFSEPSHFAIAFIPFLLHGCLVNKGWRQLFWIAVGYALGYLLENLTLVLGTTLAALICLPLWRLLAAGAVLALVLGALDLEYFTSRFDFTFESQNISSLVYRQGWELTADALSRTDGWGVGFQQLGFVPFTSPTADMLHRLLFGDLNTLDGGFLAAKVMAELGFIGIALVAAYIVLVIKVGWRVRMSVARGTQLPSKVLFSSAVICGFSIELFVRGLGYFSGSAVLFVAAVLMALTNERERRARAPQARAFH